jgi:(2R)-3-sulfolactate dehydrogenase (NADP+)
MTQLLSLPDVFALACDCLTRAGVPDHAARSVAAEIAAAEAAGERSHGMEALLRDIHLLRYGRIDAGAEPRTDRPRSAMLRVDAQHGFAAAALAQVPAQLVGMAQEHGVAMARLDRASAPGAMIRAIQPMAENGLVALAYAATGPGRIAHPDLAGPVTLTRKVREALEPVLAPPDAAGYADVAGQPDDSPLGGPVAHSAWISAMHLDTVGEDLLDAEIWASTPPLDPTGEIAFSVDLLEQIVTA